MKLLFSATVGLALVSALVPARAQTIEFNLDALSAKAKEKAEITLEGPMLTQALQGASEKVKGAVASVSRLILRHYEFAKAGEYSSTDLEQIRKQVSNG